MRGIAYEGDNCAQKECRAKREEGLTDRLSLSAPKDAVSLQWEGPANGFDTCPRLSSDYRGQKDKLPNHCGCLSSHRCFDSFVACYPARQVPPAADQAGQP